MFDTLVQLGHGACRAGTSAQPSVCRRAGHRSPRRCRGWRADTAGPCTRGSPRMGALSNRILHFGAIGAGTAYKLIVNLMGAVQIASLAEGMALAERIGLDLDAVANAISTGQAASPQVVRNARRIVAGDHDRNVVFTPVLRLKDTDYALKLAQGIGMRAPFGRVAARQLQELIELGHSRDNESKIIEVARRQRL